ncbi:methyl-accepting chemotaxis protein [Paenibacillus sp. J2TS4]|uniref:methyl-accepting chemotaxis protein n=1 Tax=Paenibacillus sp. J2TS4 TaxID=2807194 RepID=UPI001B2838BF|nr:methyl-accepting chemotaxis protein [Paenibacillus sp. J2TS4]GIP31488.1 hypothetical protein J2TS4_06980 [Paenibacillus sp. J2TS4]
MFKKSWSFRTKLTITISVFTFIVAGVLSFIDNRQLERLIVAEKKIQYQLVEDNIRNAVQNVDLVYDVFEQDMEERMKASLELMAKKYMENPYFDTWDFAALKEQFNDMDIFVIDKQTTVAYSSLASDIGLSFANAKEFAALLHKRMEGGEFTADGMDVSVNTGAIKKFAYLPTHDHQYLLEVGVNLEESHLFKTFNFLDASERIIENYNVVNDITLFTATGYALGKQGEDGKAFKIDDELLPSFQEAFETQQVQEVELSRDGSLLTYHYVPYKLDDRDGDLSRSRIIEIVYHNEELAQIIAEQKRVFWFKLAISALGALLISWLIGRLLTKPIVRMGHLIDRTAQFELKEWAVDVEKLNSRDEMGAMARSIMVMRQQLNEMVHKLISVSDSISDNAREVKQSTDGVTRQSNGAAEAAKQLFSHMQETMAVAEEMNATLSDIQTVIAGVTEQTAEAASTSQEVSERAVQLKEISLASRATADQIYADVKEQTETAIRQSASSMEQIHRLVSAILEISEQTHLLALNAAIEAERAGDSGRGFAVVAGEVRKLAAQSSVVVSDIQRIIISVEESVNHLAESSSKVLEFIDRQVQPDYVKLIDTSEQYNGDAAYFNHLLTEFSASFEQLQASISSTASALGQVTSSISDNVQRVEEITSQSAGIADNNGQIASISNQNVESANTLREIVKRFKV